MEPTNGMADWAGPRAVNGNGGIAPWTRVVAAERLLRGRCPCRLEFLNGELPRTRLGPVTRFSDIGLPHNSTGLMPISSAFVWIASLGASLAWPARNRAMFSECASVRRSCVSKGFARLPGTI